MKSLNYASFIEEAAREVSEETEKSIVWSKNWDISFNANADKQRGKMILLVWQKAFKAVGIDGKGVDDTAANKVIDFLLASGVDIAAVHPRRSCFRVNLPNLEYRIYRRCPGIGVRPWVLGYQAPLRTVDDLKSEIFAEFLLGFDAIIPEIDQKWMEILPHLQEIVRECRKKYMVKEMMTSTVQAMIDQYLVPEDMLETSFTVDSENNQIKLHISQKRALDLKCPFEELVRLLADRTSLLSSLKPTKESRIESYSPLHRLPDLIFT